ncbi:(-)-germacrene D synthase, partial [Linum grandiflorum]
ADVLSKFKDGRGNFKEELSTDVKGLLSLYEAAYYRVNEEELLDEALEFTTTHLKPIAKSAGSSPTDGPLSLASKVGHSLKYPILKGLPIAESRHFMSVYQQDENHSEAILKLGKLDFNKRGDTWRRQWSAT